MSHGLLRDARVYGVLFRIDEDETARAQGAGCACGGRLHRADYRRKPRCGLDLEKGVPGFSIRHSLCCDRDGCRRRATPASVRFLGRRVYVGLVVVLIAALAEGATPARVRRLRQLVGDVSRRTLDRWRRWWREAFPTTELWRERRAHFATPVATDRLPASLLERAPGADDAARLTWLLRWLAPITTSGSHPPDRAS